MALIFPLASKLGWPKHRSIATPDLRPEIEVHQTDLAEADVFVCSSPDWALRSINDDPCPNADARLGSITSSLCILKQPDDTG